MNNAARLRLDRLANGYRDSQVLFAALRLGIFAALGRRRLTAQSLADTLGLNLRATRILCDALCALRLLRKTRSAYANSTLAQEFLLPESPGAQGPLFLHGARLYEAWGQLYDVVKTGQPADRSRVDTRLPGDPRAFAAAVAAAARWAAPETAARLDLRGVRTLLDIGGGPGSYAIEFARRHPRLQATVLDSAATLEVARENIARAGLADRVAVRPGDALRDDLGGPYDMVVVSNLIHSLSEADNRLLARRSAAALAPGGCLAVKDFLLAPTRTSPRVSALFAVNMLVNTPGGDCYTAAEVRRWFREAGLTPGRAPALTPPSALVLGRKSL